MPLIFLDNADITYFLTSWRTLRIFDVITYFMSSWRNLWRYDILLDVMIYFLTAGRIFHTFWLHDVHFMLRYTFGHHGIMYIFCDVMAYFMTYPLTSWLIFHSLSWRTFWRYDVLCDVMIYFLTSRHTSRCYEVRCLHHDVCSILFDVMTYFLTLYILVDVMTYFT